MFPLTCPDGTGHNFETPAPDATGMYCTKCKVDYDEYHAAERKKDEIKNHILELTAYINGGNHDLMAEAMMEAMHMTHRTIQQNFFRGLALFIQKMSGMPVDMRNEACVAWCKNASKIEALFPRI